MSWTKTARHALRSGMLFQLLQYLGVCTYDRLWVAETPPARLLHVNSTLSRLIGKGQKGKARVKFLKGTCTWRATQPQSGTCGGRARKARAVECTGDFKFKVPDAEKGSTSNQLLFSFKVQSSSSFKFQQLQPRLGALPGPFASSRLRAMSMRPLVSARLRRLQVESYGQEHPAQAQCGQAS